MFRWMMFYFLIPLFGSVLLGCQHLFLTDASRRSKIAVAVIVITSLLVFWYFPAWMVLATLLQVGVSLYMLLYLKWSRIA